MEEAQRGGGGAAARPGLAILDPVFQVVRATHFTVCHLILPCQVLSPGLQTGVY